MENNFTNNINDVMHFNIEALKEKLNIIFSKVLLEKNSYNKSFLSKFSNIELNDSELCNKHKMKILIITDIQAKNINEFNSKTLNIEHKLLFLLKSNNISIDCFHIGDHNKELEIISYITNGIYNNINSINESLQYFIVSNFINI